MATFKKSLLFLLAFSELLFPHGFSRNTLVTTTNKKTQIQLLCHYVSQRKKLYVPSCNISNKSQITQKIASAGRSSAPCYMRLGFDEWFNDDVVCTPTQEFFLANERKWIPAYQLKVGDELLAHGNKSASITHMQLVKNSLRVYSLEIENTHTFFVGRHSILTHNVILPLAFTAGLSVPFGSGAVAGGAAGSLLGPVTFVGGLLLGGVVGVVAKKLFCDKQIPEYKITFCANDFDLYVKNDKKAVKSSKPENGASEFGGIFPDPENNDKNKEKKICEKSAKHIFRDASGHLKDTVKNRDLLKEVASNDQNYLGTDSHGTDWYAKTLSNGKQAWANVRGSLIRNGGVNDTPRVFNTETGLCKLRN